MQSTVINAISAGENVLAIMPTGSGKSLCYQLPAVMEDGLTMVVSPLLALMRDQMSKLRALGIPCFQISSAQSDEERHAHLASLQIARHGLLYLSPEQLGKGSIRYFLDRLKITRMVVDEAHCFSEWGHDFRPDYRAIPQFLYTHPKTALSAFTATATARAIEDLRQNLFKGRSVRVLALPMRRDEIAIEFTAKHKPRAQLLAQLRDEPTLIYAGTRAKTEVLAQAIRKEGYAAKAYHAGMENEARVALERGFLAGDFSIIVATNAFGMGVDHPNIRQVIHADLPNSIEAYVQEIGRAGRDGKPARAFTLFGEDDIALRREQIETSITNPTRRSERLQAFEALVHLAQQGGGWDEIERYFKDTNSPNEKNQTSESPILALKRWRQERARAQKVPPYFILPDEILKNISAANPTDFDQLAAVKGMGETRLQKYGSEILAALGISAPTPRRARQKLTLKGKGDIYERLKSSAQSLRFGALGNEKPLECTSALLNRIIQARPQNWSELENVHGMNKARMERFGEAFLIDIQNETR